VGFLASVRLGKGRANILHDRTATKNRYQSRFWVLASATSMQGGGHSFPPAAHGFRSITSGQF